jgi:hypothetical protein
MFIRAFNTEQICVSVWGGGLPGFVALNQLRSDNR